MVYKGEHEPRSLWLGLEVYTAPISNTLQIKPLIWHHNAYCDFIVYSATTDLLTSPQSSSSQSYDIVSRTSFYIVKQSYFKKLYHKVISQSSVTKFSFFD